MSLTQVSGSLRIHKIPCTLACDIYFKGVFYTDSCVAVGKDLQLPWEADNEIRFINLFTLSTTLLLPEFL